MLRRWAQRPKRSLSDLILFFFWSLVCQFSCLSISRSTLVCVCYSCQYVYEWHRTPPGGHDVSNEHFDKKQRWVYTLSLKQCLMRFLYEFELLDATFTEKQPEYADAEFATFFTLNTSLSRYWIIWVKSAPSLPLSRQCLDNEVFKWKTVANSAPACSGWFSVKVSFNNSNS